MMYAKKVSVRHRNRRPWDCSALNSIRNLGPTLTLAIFPPSRKDLSPTPPHPSTSPCRTRFRASFLLRRRATPTVPLKGLTSALKNVPLPPAILTYQFHPGLNLPKLTGWLLVSWVED